MTSLLEQINGYLFGGQPIKRQDRKAGETQYYYINPGQEYATAGSLKTTDIPDEMMNPDGTMKTTGSFNNMQKYNQEVMNNHTNPSNINVPRYWETAAEGKQVYDNVIQQENYIEPQPQNILGKVWSSIKAVNNITHNYDILKNQNVTDKYKHAMINCQPAQYGRGGEFVAGQASFLREMNDLIRGKNTLDSSIADNYANRIGRLLGRKYPEGDCDELIQRYINKKY